MTNREKFKETFGFNIDTDHLSSGCVAPWGVCETIRGCDECPFDEWWDREYKPCFQIKEGFDD